MYFSVDSTVSFAPSAVPALVCAFVVEREDFVLGVAEDGDVAAGGALHDARAQAGDVVERADAFPVGHGGESLVEMDSGSVTTPGGRGF